MTMNNDNEQRKCTMTMYGDNDREEGEEKGERGERRGKRWTGGEFILSYGDNIFQPNFPSRSNFLPFNPDDKQRLRLNGIEDSRVMTGCVNDFYQRKN